LRFTTTTKRALLSTRNLDDTSQVAASFECPELRSTFSADHYERTSPDLHRRPPRRNVAVRVLRLVAFAQSAIILGFLFQLAITLAATLRRPKPIETFDSALFQTDHNVLDFASLLGHNLIVFAVFFTSALLLTGWRPHRIVALGRPVVALITVILVADIFWPLAGQDASVAAQLHASPLILLLVLPHGPLEFGGFFLPLIVAVWSRSASSDQRMRDVCYSLVISLPLLALAAALECWLSPVLLSIPLLGGLHE
jgi:hypothetical protein